LSAIERVPFLVPPVVGSKKTPIEQELPTERLFPQALSEPKSVGLVVTEEIIRGLFPLLVNVTLWGSPEVPTYCSGKIMLDGEIMRMGPLPTPLKGTTCGLPAALSLIASEAL